MDDPHWIDDNWPGLDGPAPEGVEVFVWASEVCDECSPLRRPNRNRPEDRE